MSKVIVIGYGPAGVIAAQRILEIHPDLQMQIYDSGLRHGSFTLETPAFLLNTKVQDMNVSDRYPFYQYLMEHGMKRESDFVPRHWYGKYLEHFRKKQLQDPRVTLILKKITLDDPSLKGQTLIYCGGEVKPNPVSVDPSKLFEHPWNLEKLSKLKPEAKILFVGTSLSFLDVLNFLRSENHHFTAISRTKAKILAHLPTMRELNANLLKELQAASTLRAILKIFIKMSDAERYSAVKLVRGRQAKLWQGFSPREKKQFKKWVAPYWRVNRHRAPPAMITMMDQIEKAGKLRFIQGKVENLDLAEYDYVMSTSGFQAPPSFDTDQNYQTKNGTYCVGIVNYQNHFESNAVPDFIQQTMTIANHLKTRFAK